MGKTFTGGGTISGARLPLGTYTLEEAAAVLNADPGAGGTFSVLNGSIHFSPFTVGLSSVKVSSVKVSPAAPNRRARRAARART